MHATALQVQTPCTTRDFSCFYEKKKLIDFSKTIYLYYENTTPSVHQPLPMSPRVCPCTEMCAHKHSSYVLLPPQVA